MRHDVMREVGRLGLGLWMLAVVGCQPPSGTGPVAGPPEPVRAPKTPPAEETPPEPRRPEPQPRAVPEMAYETVPAAAAPRLLAALTSDRSDLLEALDRSIAWFGKPSSRESFPMADITHAHAWTSVGAFRDLVARHEDPEELERRIVAEFDFFSSLGEDGRGTVLFTGYYAPLFFGSRSRDAVYRYPLYGPPADLVVDAETGDVIGRRVGGRIVTPYPTRAEIEESGLLRGSEVVWLRDAFEAYLVQLQGSASIRYQDGSVRRFGYAGNNGHEYVSVSRELLADGKLAEDEISLDEVRGYFDAYPEDLDRYLHRNPRFIFFQEVEGSNWPAGSLGVKVTPLRSLATDKDLFPPGGVVFVVTDGPGPSGRIRRFEQLMLDQDSGGAIRSPGRADIYYGVGPEAETRAGGQYSHGRLYYLFLKPDRLEVWRSRLRSQTNR